VVAVVLKKSDVPNSDTKILIIDTSVLINFLNINRIDLLSHYPGEFLITEHVVDEVITAYPVQVNLLYSSIADGIISVVSVNETIELEIFNKLLNEHRLGQGECSAIACAINRKFYLAIDDVTARKKAAKESHELIMINTQDIIITLIQSQVLTVAEADLIKIRWENEFRFALKIKSFSELMDFAEPGL
jgi:predicted nucleic acid-binding protein